MAEYGKPKHALHNGCDGGKASAQKNELLLLNQPNLTTGTLAMHTSTIRQLSTCAHMHA
jgi:hypothetical protein